MAASKNYYEEIGVSQNASVEEITNVVKQLVKTNHPDNFTDAQQRLRLVKRAYETLKDENLRWEYDLSLFGDSENTSNHNATKHPTKSKTSSFKFISGLILGTAAVTASGTIYLSGLDCSNQRNAVDATICEKTQPIRSLFGSDEKQPVVAEASKIEPETIAQDTAVSNQTPVETPTPEIEQSKNEPAPALASATVSFDNSTPVKSEPELPTATASFQPVASTPVATTNNANDECYNLWYQRNLIYAQNGYCFTSNLGKIAFKDFKCFSTSQNLSGSDKAKVDSFKSREATLNCKVDANATTIPTATQIAPVQNQIATTPNLTPSTLPETSVQSANANPIQTLVAEGVGITPQDAAQNAAENALKNVVGTFIDSNMNLEKKTLIYDGLKSETKNISKDIKEYSQGSIKSFEIIDVKQQAGLYRLTAKVTVRNEQFSAYVKQLAKGEASINEGLFPKISTNAKQKENLASILGKDILAPILSGNVQEFKIGKIELFSDVIKEKSLPSWAIEKLTENNNQRIKDNVVIFKVETFLKEDFLKNLNNTLKNISTKHEDIDDSYLKHHVVTKFTGTHYEVEKTFILKNNSHGIWEYFEFDLDGGIPEIQSNLVIKITIKDENNSTLKIFSSLNASSIVIAGKHHNPWNLFYTNSEPLPAYVTVPRIFEKSEFYVVLDIDENVMRDAKKIMITFEK